MVYLRSRLAQSIVISCGMGRVFGDTGFLDMGREILLIICLSFSSIANAATITVAFPSSSTSYFSATNGSGIIPLGGQSADMWTSGDYVKQTFTLGLASVNGISADWLFQDNLNASTETLDFFINGVDVGFVNIAPHGGAIMVITGAGSFTDIPPILGTYTLKLVLHDTLTDGGTIAFLDRGTAGFTGPSSVPEPSTFLLLGAGLGGLALLKRKSSRS